MTFRLRRAARWLLTLAIASAPGLAARAQEVPISPDAAGLSAEALKKIDQALDDAVAAKKIAGAVALIVRERNVGYFRAAGQRDVEAGLPMTRDTLFRIASMTKPVTSVAAMILVDDGKIALDDPVAKFIPEFKDMKVLVPVKDGEPKLEPAKQTMTVRHLLTHTSGLAYRFLSPPALRPYYSKAEILDGLSEYDGTLADNVRKIAAQPLDSEPGTKVLYSLSTDVLGRVVEVASGQTLDAFFAERIFKPLKMHDTFFFVPDDRHGRVAAVYTIGPDTALKRAEDKTVAGELIWGTTFPLKGPKKYLSGGAGLVSTAGDYARFLQMMLNGGELDGARVLKPETVKAMTSDQLGELPYGENAHGDRFGFGFGVVTPKAKRKDLGSVGSFSWAGFYTTYFWADPEKKLIGVLMTQSYPSLAPGLRDTFRKATYEALAK